jgi:hypothetical protein
VRVKVWGYLTYFLSFFLLFWRSWIISVNVSGRAALHGMYTWSVGLYNGGFGL